MGNLDTFYQAQEIEHLPDARDEISKSATQMSQPDYPTFEGMVIVVAGMSIFLNIILFVLLIISYMEM